jgi:hypothetical protein
MPRLPLFTLKLSTFLLGPLYLYLFAWQHNHVLFHNDSAITAAASLMAPQPNKDRRHPQDEAIEWVSLPSAFQPELHNRTADGRPLPGLFWDNRLLLLGARLTTSYEVDDHRVQVTVFGMPGDFWYREKNGEVRCQSNAWYGKEHNVWSYPNTKSKARLYVSVNDRTKKPIYMEHIPTVSADGNQNNVTHIWSADLAPFLSKEDLRQRILQQDDGATAIRLYFWAAAAAAKKEGNQTQSRRSPLMSVDIPLSTGVVGNAGPQTVQPSSSSLMIQEEQEQEDPSPPNMEAALCVAIYGDDALRVLPEFILHHSNIGFGQVIVGIVDGLMGSVQMAKAHDALADFVDEGRVTLAAFGLPDLDCEVNVRKIHFYNSCLYHSKGLAKYVGIWDVDEYWVPPLDRTEGVIETKNQTSSSSLSLFQDDIWKQSNYSSAISVSQAMATVQEYQESANCGEEWCFHAFPSWIVYMRRDSHDHIPSERSGLVATDFHLREKDIDWSWSKSITRTKYANMGGLHQTGSCRFGNSKKFLPRKAVEWNVVPYGPKEQSCRNLRQNGFGMIHHYYSLNRIRSHENKDYREECMEGNQMTCPGDEYVERFGKTVQQQLLARQEKLATPKH